jgi:hypothetical protein
VARGGEAVRLRFGKERVQLPAIFISSGYGHGCALLDISGDSLNKVWENRNMKNKHCCSVLYKGAIYGFDETKLACIGLEKGDTKWSEGLGRGTVAMADGKLIVLPERGELIIAEASTAGFKKLSFGRILRNKCWTVPVLANGKIYARDAGKKGVGDLVCVTVNGK